jgi:hypothetical protein
MIEFDAKQARENVQKYIDNRHEQHINYFSEMLKEVEKASSNGATSIHYNFKQNQTDRIRAIKTMFEVRGFAISCNKVFDHKITMTISW